MDANESTAIKQLVDRLSLTYPDLSPETIATVVRHNHARFEGWPVRYFVPLFVERSSMRELAQKGFSGRSTTVRRSADRGRYWQRFFISRKGWRMPSRSDLACGLLVR